MYTMSLYIVNNKYLYKMNVENHNFNTRCKINLYPPISNVTKFQKGAYYFGIMIFSQLPANTKCLTNDLERFRIALKMFLSSNAFYTLEEFFNYDR